MRSLIKQILLFISSIIYYNKKSKIIFYHDVYGDNKYTDMGTSLSMFIKHIQAIIKEGFNIVPTIENQENEVMICFDDGFKGIYDTRSFFIENGIYPTVFLAVSLIGQPGYLNKKEILELQDAGFIFQCHAWSHTDLTQFTREELKRELNESRIILTRILQKPVDEICFPIGYFSQLVLNECIRYGYKKMYSSIPGNYYDHVLLEGLYTRNLLQFATPNEMKFVLHGGNELIKNKYINMHWKEEGI